MERRYIHAHTALRGIAALLVVVYHLGFGDGTHFEIEITPFFRRGYLWVDLFFILSGFIISYTSGDVNAGSGAPAIRGFLIRRVARIYPLHIVALAYLLLFVAVTSIIARSAGESPWSAQSIAQLGAQATLLSAWGIIPGVGWNIPSWSISAEMVAYLAFPVLMTVTRTSVGRLMLVLAAISFYVTIGAMTGVLDITQGVALLRALAGFSLGVILNHERARFAALGDTTLSVIQSGALVWILVVMAIPSNDSLAIPAFVALIGSTWMDRGIVAQMLAFKPLQWLGEISYSVYLIHVPILATLSFGWARTAARLGMGATVEHALFLVVAMALVLLITTLTYRYVETPGRRWVAAHFMR